MENIDEVKQAEVDLKRAEAELGIAQRDEQSAQAAEQAAVTDIDAAVHELREAEAHHHEIHFTVDGEECETRKHKLTPNQIISEFGKQDPAISYLVEIRGTHKVSYQGKGDEEIKLHDCDHFQIVSTGPKPVSDCAGAAAFVEGLRTLGYEPNALPNSPDHVVFNYPVEVGRFAGQTVRLGFVVPPDFPNITPSGPHVSPHVRAIHPTNDLPHPDGGVHQSQSEAFQKGAGGAWQYWSRPCADWGKSKKTVTAYMAHIWRLWETQ
ncbi:MAG: hypothetical protein WA383_20070 [Terriglobales bacterium]